MRDSTVAFAAWAPRGAEQALLNKVLLLAVPDIFGPCSALHFAGLRRLAGGV